MSFLNSTTRTRPDQTDGPLGSPTSPPTLSGRRLVCSISTCTDFVRGSGRVGSGRRQSPWVRVVEFDTDQTLSETWSQARTCLVGPVPNSTTRTRTGSDRTGPDHTKSADLSETRVGAGDFTDQCHVGSSAAL